VKARAIMAHRLSAIQRALSSGGDGGPYEVKGVVVDHPVAPWRDAGFTVQYRRRTGTATATATAAAAATPAAAEAKEAFVRVGSIVVVFREVAAGRPR
jgi:hypothetical protein